MGDGRLPTFVVIGAMRSGTTSLAHWLRGHPEVHMAAQKEVHFFDLHYDRGLDWYAAQFAGGDGAKAIGEATPAYMSSESALDRMATDIPHAKLLAVLRNPVDRAYSHYWHRRLLGKERRPFLDAIDGPTSAGQPDYLGRGRYAEQLDAVARRYPRPALHVLIHEDLVQEPAATFERLCAFLGIDPSRQPDRVGRVVNAAVAFRSLRVRAATRHWPRLARNAVGRLNTRPFTYPPLPLEDAARLERRMEGANRDLEQWLGRDLSVWRRRAQVGPGT